VGKSGGTVSGYNYYIGIHFGVGHGPCDALLELRAGDLTAWSGAQTASGSIEINAPNLFGGQGREGGLFGTLDVMMGEASQQPNVYLTAQQGLPQPAYRGVMTLVYHGIDVPGGGLREAGVGTGAAFSPNFSLIPSASAAGGLIGANNPYPKPWAFKVRRAVKGWFGDAPWYAATAAIPLSSGAVGMNPAHILYEVITNPDWGMGYPAQQIDDASFRAAALQLFNEGFGLCLYWRRQDTIENFIQLLMDYIAGVLVSSPTTGLFQLNLIRGGYDPTTLPQFTADDVISLEEKEDSTITGCTNELVVRYYDPALKNAQSIIIQALGAIQAQGVVVSDVKQFPGIATADLAARVAQRELAAVSIPLKRIKIKFNRKLYTMVPGALFVLTFPDAEIASITFRVGEVDYGKLTDGSITVTAVQDNYSLPSDTYIQVQTTGWVIPSTKPAVPTVYHGFEAGYRDLVLENGAAAVAAMPAATGYLATAVGRPNGLQYSYAVASAPAPYTTFTAKVTAHFCPAATIQGALGLFDTACTFLELTDPALVSIGMAAMILDGSSFEIIRIDAFDSTSGIATIARGCADSVPATHGPGVRVFFYDQLLGTDNIEYTAGEVIEVCPLTNAGQGQLALALAPVITIAIVGRSELPYPPGAILVNGIRSDLLTAPQASPLVLTWASRNRLTQAETLIDATMGAVTPEAGTTYTITFLDSTFAPFLTVPLCPGATFTWSQDTSHTELYVEVQTVTPQGTSAQAQRSALITMAAYTAPPPPPPVPILSGGSSGTVDASEMPTVQMFLGVENLFIVWSYVFAVSASGVLITYYTSPDGLTWSTVADPHGDAGFPGASGEAVLTLSPACVRDGKIYAVEASQFWTSVGLDFAVKPWTEANDADGGALQTVNGAGYLNGQFLAWGDSHTTQQPVISASPDFATWTDYPVGLPYLPAENIFSDPMAIFWDPGRARYVIVSNWSNTTHTPAALAVRFYTSPDLLTFTELAAAGTPSAQVQATAQNGATLVAVGNAAHAGNPYAAAIWTSTDTGNTWTVRFPTVPVALTYFTTPGSGALEDVVFDGTAFVCAGYGYCGQSTDGIAWVMTATSVGVGAALYTNGAGAVMRVEESFYLTGNLDAFGSPLYASTPALYTSSDHGGSWVQQFGPAS